MAYLAESNKEVLSVPEQRSAEVHLYSELPQRDVWDDFAEKCVTHATVEAKQLKALAELCMANIKSEVKT